MGCLNAYTNKITYTILVTPDNINTPNFEGKVFINNISGGTLPYNVYWTILKKTSDYIEVMPEGKYEFYLYDANNCMVKDTAVIGTYLSTNEFENNKSFHIYPNPIKNELFIELNINDFSNCFAELINSEGRVIKHLTLTNNITKKVELNNIKSGIYLLRINSNNSVYSKKIIVI